MIKLFLSVTLVAAFMGLVACEPTSTSTTAVEATPTPVAKTESADTVTETSDTPSKKTESTPAPKGGDETTPTPGVTTEIAETAETPQASDAPIVSTESTGNVTGEGSGTVTDYSPGEMLTLKTETGEPLSCKFGEIVTYVTSDGKVIDASKIRRDSKVRVLYHKDGDDTVVDKVIVTEAR